MTNAVAYALLWLSFGVLHSILARPQAKAYFNHLLGSKYRLAYNLLAAMHILVVMYAGRHLYSGTAPMTLSTWQTQLANISIVCGVVIMLMALRQYDLGLFSGIKQWRNGDNTSSEESPLEPLNTGGLNQFVRHPLYTGAFLYLWGNATSSYGLMTALWGSIYLLVGTVFEERQLIRIYGASYRRYQASVPAYIPWKGKQSDL